MVGPGGGPEAPGPTLGDRILASPVTAAITVVNIAVFLAAEHYGDTTTTETLVRFGASERSRLWAGEYWRLVTPMFLHIGWIHLIWNTYMLFGWCAGVERTLGPWRFAVAYLGSGIGATAVSVLGHDVVSAGASGAGFGVIGVTWILAYRRLGSWRAFWENPAVRQMLLSVGIWVAIGFFALRMDNHAHLGGLAFGLALGWMLVPRRERADRAAKVALAAAVVVMLAVVGAAPVPWPGRTSLWGAFEAARRGEAALAAGEPALAVREFDRAEALGFRVPEIYANRGLAYDALDQPMRALADLNLAVALSGGDPQARTQRGYVLCRLGKHDEAVADFDAAIELDAAYALVHANRAFCLFELGRLEEALVSADRAVELDAVHTWALYRRAQIENSLGRREEAIRDLEAYLERAKAREMEEEARELLGELGR